MEDEKALLTFAAAEDWMPNIWHILLYGYWKLLYILARKGAISPLQFI
jgi:hypothetical protein